MTRQTGQSGWTAEEIKLLGTQPDGEVARLIRRSVEAVTLKRQKLRIPAPLQPNWTAEEVKLLGTQPDRAIARRLGRSVLAVQTKRLALGIPIFRSPYLRAGQPVAPQKVKLFFGPYHSPRTRRGKSLICEMRGTVKVGGYSGGPIPWPVKGQPPSLLLCGDLIRAVRQESALAVAHHWGVCTAVVGKWRRALNIGRTTPGTARLKSAVQTKAMTPAVRLHLSRVKTGKPIPYSRAGKARLLAALHRPKTARWFKSMARHFAARRGKPVNPHHRAWTPAEDALLGTAPDREVARKINRSVDAVAARRNFKEIACVGRLWRPWRDSELKLLGRIPDAEVARRTGHPLTSVGTKRRTLRRWLRPPPKPWTPAEERLLGRKPDTEVAKLLGRERTAVLRRRVGLHIKPAVARPPHRDWTPAEDRLLGTAPDAVIARRLGRSEASVRNRRGGLGWPSHWQTMEQARRAR